MENEAPFKTIHVKTTGGNMSQMALKETEALARPLKVLVPLIKEEIELGDAAGLEHYRAAGEMLLEAKSQVEHGEWKGWLERNFKLSQQTASTYMKLVPALKSKNQPAGGFSSMREALRPNEPSRATWHEPVKEILNERVAPSIDRYAQERQDKEKELQLMRKLANELIDIGFKVLATKLHPDKGGSQEAMSRLNKVKNLLKQAI
jgi:DUF3102 family protein